MHWIVWTGVEGDTAGPMQKNVCKACFTTFYKRVGVRQCEELIRTQQTILARRISPNLATQLWGDDRRLATRRMATLREEAPEVLKSPVTDASVELNSSSDSEDEKDPRDAAFLDPMEVQQAWDYARSEDRVIDVAEVQRAWRYARSEESRGATHWRGPQWTDDGSWTSSRGWSSWAKPSWSERALVQVAERIAFSQTRWAISLLIKKSQPAVGWLAK